MPSIGFRVQWNPIRPHLGLTTPAKLLSLFLFLFFFFFLLLFRATLAAYGSSQKARGWIGAAAANLHHSNTESKPHLRPTPQLTAMPDPRPTLRGQGLNPHPHGYQSDLFHHVTMGTPKTLLSNTVMFWGFRWTRISRNPIKPNITVVAGIWTRKYRGI